MSLKQFVSVLERAKQLYKLKIALLLWVWLSLDGVSLHQHLQVSLSWTSFQVCTPCGLLSRSLAAMRCPAQFYSAMAAKRTER